METVDTSARSTGGSTIDVYHPLYLHPSDIPGVNLITKKLTGTENYGVWSRAMLIALCAKNKQAFINGSCPRPASDSDTLHIWERCNAIVLSWIMNSVSKEIFGGIVYSTNAATVWTDLKERFDKVNGSRIFSLHREIGRLTQGNHTISTYFSKLRQLWDEFESLVTLPSCACDSAKKYIEHDQQHKLLQFLMGLNEGYTYVRSQILMMSPLPSVSQAFAILSQEESHCSLLATPPIPLDASVTAFYSAQGKSYDKRRDIII
ncbi:uncharacterized protein [Henckelia pumila]|uniref:uncharacterized protein n=1 Tax=Henckelia pumila TaxID=405737 RepID=UPI003C6E38AB